MPAAIAMPVPSATSTMCNRAKASNTKAAQWKAVTRCTT